MARKGGNPNPQAKGKPTTQVGFSQQFVSPWNAQGASKSWPTLPSDLYREHRPANPLNIKHAGGGSTKSKDNKA
jgi:hypothetical protein